MKFFLSFFEIIFVYHFSRVLKVQLIIKYINIPGINNSGPEHWQTHWEILYGKDMVRVNQNNWSHPEKHSWVKGLNDTVMSQSDDVILIAHSLGCITAAHWAEQFVAENIVAALFVAPADVENSSSEKLKSFAPLPQLPLPFPTIVVASTNDPYAEITRAAEMANIWEAELVKIGNVGHINASSGIGIWNQGLDILQWLEKSNRNRHLLSA
ncbi:alpha/beta hydrolase [Pollutibacter soli]|uniref:RBBP9/YdeN family alpha/beta hydrolase n=1 Tax=Pollutibacter soli TaxID=3034157 RepID=UPI0030132A10